MNSAARDAAKASSSFLNSPAVHRRATTKPHSPCTKPEAIVRASTTMPKTHEP